MLRIWGRRNSLNVQKVLWAIGELGLPHQHIDADGDFEGLDTPDFLAMNPHGRIPVIDDDGLRVWESHSILRYLSATYGAGSLWQVDAGLRSQADRWMDWMLATLQPDFMGLFWGFYRTPQAQRDDLYIKRVTEACSRHFILLNEQLQTHDFIVGNDLTMGDIPVGAALYRYFEMDIDRPDVPAVESWYARLAERPAFRLHVMRPFDELRGKLDF